MGREYFRREKEKGSIQISFGDIHTCGNNPERRYVILDVGKKDWFMVSQIIDFSSLGFPGTGHASDIKKIVGHMSLEQILEGLRNSAIGLNPEFEKDIYTNSRKPSRNISK